MGTVAGFAAGAVEDLSTTSAGVWIALGIALLLLGSLCIRVVAEHERVVVSRLGRVTAVRGPGLVLRVPGLERLATVSLRPKQVAVGVLSTTRDGVQVRVLADGLCRVTDPQSTIASRDPYSDTTGALERGLAKAVGHTDLAALLAARERFESRVPRDVTTITAAWGVEVLELEISDFEVRLTADLLRITDRQIGSGDR
jgi:regulator of protease activity HflC (stomatin/prohibitin superfamily)